jgi:phosphatidylserine decarboxylase
MIDGVAYFINSPFIKITLLCFSVILFSITLYFFRDPKRTIPDNLEENTILSPADGKIVAITDTISKDDKFFNLNEKLKQVSIFLSPLNVHVNRIPLTGIIKYLNYIKGDYIVAFDNKSSERNERTEIGIINRNGYKILFKQIAGYVARRIVYELKESQEVAAGEKFGMIKFGSRVDILLNSDFKLKVNKGQKVKGGITVIATL